MIDPRKFKAPFNPKERIWQEADKLRATHPAGRSLPVQILDVAEFDLGLDLAEAAKHLLKLAVEKTQAELTKREHPDSLPSKDD